MVLKRLIGLALAACLAIVSLIGFAAPARAADVVTGHKVKLSYAKACSTKNGKLYVKLSKKAKSNTMLCSGRVSTDKYGVPMYMNFIITKRSKAGHADRVNVLLHLSPKVSKKWKHDTVTVKPFAVGYKYSGKSTRYTYAIYKWLNNLAAKNVKLVGEFLVTSQGNRTGRSFTFDEELRLPVYFSRTP